MGKPAPTVPLSVINANGARAETGETGDIALLMSELSGTGNFFGVFDGYLNEDGSIDRREKRYTTDDGETQIWYLTGDKAKVDKDGYFWFVGRSDDVINSSGYRIGTFGGLPAT
jgi:medium-chain acyl-CoA synthetase